MSKQMTVRYLLLCLLMGTWMTAPSQANALTVSKGAVSHLGTCGDGHGLPGCTFCSPSQSKCYMVQSCKGKKCTVITVEDQRGTKSGPGRPVGGRQQPTNGTTKHK
jgi:hypothetical protein